MALTETRPESHAATPAAGVPAPTIDGVLGTGDHKTIGRVFIGAGLVLLIAGLALGVVGIFMANNLDDLSADGMDRLAQVWSISRDLTLFGGVVPILIGIALYIVPLQIGAPSLAFARGAAASLWTWLLGNGLLILAYIYNGGPGGGRRDFIILWAAGLAMMLGGLVWAMVCLAATILGGRTQGMTLERAPLTTWAFFVFSLVGIFSLPITMGELLLSFLRVRYFHLVVSQSSELTGVMDGVSLAPALYWIGIPVLGMGVDMIATHTGRPIAYHRSVMVAIGLFGILTFGADVVGLASLRPIDFNNAFLVVGVLGAVVPVLATLGLAGDSIRFGTVNARVPLIGALVSGLLLLLGTVVALLALIEPIMGFLDSLFPDSIDMSNTLILNGTRFHEGIRALVVGAALVGIIGALHHWSTKIWGRRLAEPLGLLSVLAAAGGAVLWALGEVIAGYDDQPWLPARSTEDASGLAQIALVGAAIMAVGAAVLLANLAMSVAGSKRAGSSPNSWSGTTLEWATASPPPVGNFPAAPIVTSANPLADGELRYVGDTADEGDESGGSDEAADGEGEG